MLIKYPNFDHLTFAYILFIVSILKYSLIQKCYCRIIKNEWIDIIIDFRINGSLDESFLLIS